MKKKSRESATQQSFNMLSLNRSIHQSQSRSKSRSRSLGKSTVFKATQSSKNKSINIYINKVKKLPRNTRDEKNRRGYVSGKIERAEIISIPIKNPAGSGMSQKSHGEMSNGASRISGHISDNTSAYSHNSIYFEKNERLSLGKKTKKGMEKMWKDTVKPLWDINGHRIYSINGPNKKPSMQMKFPRKSVKMGQHLLPCNKNSKSRSRTPIMKRSSSGVQHDHRDGLQSCKIC